MTVADLAFAQAPIVTPCGAALSFDAALARMTEHLFPLESECVTLREARFRVLAAPVVAAAASPASDLAAMDGYAVRNINAGAGTVVLSVVGEAAPGQPYPLPLGHGEAVRIFTGASVPSGADRVVPQELASRAGHQVAIPTQPGGSTHIRRRGSDFAAGAELLPTGRVLDPRAILVAAAADAGTLRVRRRPRLFTLATGDEVRLAGSAMRACSIPDSVSPAVSALAESFGCESVGAAISADCIEEIAATARDAIARCDILVLCGGASVGERDFSKTAMRQIGLDLVFADVTMKPGKPVWFGRVGAVHVLGLPGNPTAALVAARLFLPALIAGLAGGESAAALQWRNLPLRLPLAKGGSRETFLCGVTRDGTVEAIERQFASGQASLACANALIRRPADDGERRSGDCVQVLEW
jgi:molybdopterin molybdotransferase